MNEIEIVDNAPVGTNWFRLELPYERHDGLRKWRQGYYRLTKVKEFMAREGLRLNIDFKIDVMYYYDRVILYLSPESEKYASMITLKWDPKDYD